ncbi:MAG: type VI secretion system ATPase TssH [Candidatus Eisenbacteria bacterium]
MMDVDLKALIRKLNRPATRFLETAAGLSVSRGHHEVTPEHLLLVMLDDPLADAQAILRHYGISPAPVLAAVQKVLEQYRAGSSGRPVFSPLLLEWVQDAWMLASIEYADTQVRSGTLMLALFLRPERYAADEITRHFAGIKRDELRRDLYRITGKSKEAEAQVGLAGEAHPGAPGRPVEETAIGRFTIDVTERARRGEIDPIFGRDREIRQMIDILARRRKNNPIVVGEPGVGKTAVVEGLALRIVSGDVPDILKNVRLLSLDLGLLQAGAGVRGEFENRLRGVIQEVKASPVPIITFIDEAHTLIGAGGAAGSGDAANMLKPALARGELRTVAATTWSEYKKYFEKDAALERRFQVVKLDEPSEADAVLMMRGLRERYEAVHAVRILEEAIEAAVRLSSRYISGRQLPDKAVDLLDTAAARVRIARATVPVKVDDLDRRRREIEREREAQLRERDLGGKADEKRLAELGEEQQRVEQERAALIARWEQQKAAVQHVLDLRARLAGDGAAAPTAATPGAAPEPGPAPPAATAPPTPPPDPEKLRAELETALRELREMQGDDPLAPLDVDGRVVASIVSNWTGIPVGKMMRDEAALVLGFRERLGERIKGQDHALDAVDRGIRAARAGLKNPKTPIGVFLFVGPSGVGKTETGLTVADLMFGGERFLTTVNMSEFQEKHTVSRLIGSPPGYVGYGEGGVLTEAVRQRPYSVVLLDEVEKADPEVMNLFYQVFDKGMLQDGEGRLIDFKNTIIFLTSNLATDVIMQLCSTPVPPTGDEVIAAIRPLLAKHFKPALLGRMEIVPFLPLRGESLKQIVRLKLRQVTNRLADSHHMRLDLDPRVVDLIAARCTDVDSGARNIDHIVNQHLLPMLSTQLLQQMAAGPLPEAVRLAVDQGENFVIDFA